MFSFDINPWNVSKSYDYSKLIDKFGISPFKLLLPKINEPNIYMKRNIIFGHRNFEPIINCINNKSFFVVLDGFMPTGVAHFGHKLVMDQIIWYQKHGGSVIISIADLEAHAVRGLPLKKCFEIGINEYILNIIALGLDPEKTFFYFQSKNNNLLKLSFDLGMNINYNELSSIYGFSESTHISNMFCTLNQSSDILMPQLKEYYGPCNIVVPVGIDQDPHIRLTRDIIHKKNLFNIEKRVDSNNNIYFSIRCKKVSEELFSLLEKELKSLNFEIKKSKMHIDVFNCFNIEKLRLLIKNFLLDNNYNYFEEPSSTYHKFMTGLNGGKMSSSIPESHISLSELPINLEKKINKSKTGGKETLNEQRIYGGNPYNCQIFEFFLYHLYNNEKDINELYNDCISGKLFCGNCKKILIEKLAIFLKNHNEKKEIILSKEDLTKFLNKF